MDVARGGEQRCAKESCDWTYNNTSCPFWSEIVDSGDAWYFYADTSADYGTMIGEYIYWSVTSNIGMHDSAAGLKQASSEWCPNTKEKLKTLSGQEVILIRAASDSGQLFGSVSTKDIVNSLVEKRLSINESETF